MDTPGYDPVSRHRPGRRRRNMICFTTGRGSAFGCKPSPSIKLATNTTCTPGRKRTWTSTPGSPRGTSLDELGEEIFEEIIAVASGKRTKSELAGIGAEEFNPVDARRHPLIEGPQVALRSSGAGKPTSSTSSTGSAYGCHRQAPTVHHDPPTDLGR